MNGAGDVRRTDHRAAPQRQAGRRRTRAAASRTTSARSAISPDGRSAWVPSKQDNVKRGARRDGMPLNFQNTVRAISSRIDLAVGQPRTTRSASTTTMRASRARSHSTGAASTCSSRSRRAARSRWSTPTAAWRSSASPPAARRRASRSRPDGNRLYVNNFMDRTIGVYDLSTLLATGIADVPQDRDLDRRTAARSSTPQVLLGKQLFYDAQDTRLARDAYISCASCHNDGGQDGRTWDLTGFGEGLRNTSSLRGRAGRPGLPALEQQLRRGPGLRGPDPRPRGRHGPDDERAVQRRHAQRAARRREGRPQRRPRRAGGLRRVAQRVRAEPAPERRRHADRRGHGRQAACSRPRVAPAATAAADSRQSAGNNPEDIGTIDADSGNRLDGPLTGIDIPTLRDVWATAPYLHRGSAATLGDAIRAHAGVTVTDAELPNLVAYVAQIGSQEAGPAAATARRIPAPALRATISTT